MGTEKKTNPETYTLIVKDKFYQNFDQIVEYIAFIQKQPLNAIKVGDGIFETMAKIIENPMIYSECENIPTKTKMYREARYKTWLIVFKVKLYQIIILGVLSAKQKPNTFKKL